MLPGWNRRYKHASSALGCDMTFTVYLPPAAEAGGKVPVVWYLSGLTCTGAGRGRAGAVACHCSHEARRRPVWSRGLFD